MVGKYAVFGRGRRGLDVGTYNERERNGDTTVSPRSDNNGNGGRWLVPVVIGIVTILFSSITVAMWISTNNKISELSGKVEGVCIMQAGQKDSMQVQKELLTNHIAHLKENVDYIRKDIDEIKVKLDKISDGIIIVGAKKKKIEAEE